MRFRVPPGPFWLFISRPCRIIRFSGFLNAGSFKITCKTVILVSEICSELFSELSGPISIIPKIRWFPIPICCPIYRVLRSEPFLVSNERKQIRNWCSRMDHDTLASCEQDSRVSTRIDCFSLLILFVSF